MKRLSTILVALIILLKLTGQQSDTLSIDKEYYGKYLGFELPDSTPQIFAPGLISDMGRMHSFVSFSQDLETMFWNTIPPKIMMMKMVDGKWTMPEVVPFSNTNNNQSPFVTGDNKVYFSSTRSGGQGQLDTWYTIYFEEGFIEPVNLGEGVNSEKLESQPTVSDLNNLFFTGTVEGKLYNKGIYFSNYVNGEFVEPVLLPEPINILDSNILDYTPFIAPDESYLLFCSNRQNPERELCHIYISYKNENGDWMEPIDLSVKMGFENSSKFPYVTPDNKFLFFSSGNNLYWLDSTILGI